MTHNHIAEVKNEIQFFKEKFQQVGWASNPDHIFCKRMDFVTLPSAKNENNKYQLAMRLSPYFMSYTKEETGKSEERLEIWIKCTVGIEYNPKAPGSMWSDKCPALKQVIDCLKEDIRNIGWQAFKDEDALFNFFSLPEYKPSYNMAFISFYLNKDYPEGYWQNHTL